MEQAQKKQRKTYATRKSKQTFEGLVAGETMVKMKKPGKKKALTASWKVHTNSLDMLMGKETLTLRKAAGYASSRMRMDISGKDLVGIFKSIMFNKIE